MFTPTAANNFGNAFANGATVTQEIADYCTANGHGTWTKDGADQHTCPRCGHTEVVEVAAPKAKRATRFNPFRARSTQAEIDAYRDNVRAANKGKHYQIDSNAYGLRVECTKCHTSYTLQPELFIERHDRECKAA